MSQHEPQSLADALDRKAQKLHSLANQLLNATALLSLLAREIRAEDAELGDMRDAICDWHADKQRRLK